MAKAAAKPKKEISMEEALWKSADKLRGSVEPAEYKHVVLSLFFLKFAGDKFVKQREMIAEKYGEKFVDNIAFYTKDNIFYLPEESRWSYIIEHAKQDDIALKIDTTLYNIEKSNPALKGALPDEFEYPEDKMIELSKRIKIIVDDKARYTDWSTRDDIKANLQVDLILLLDEFDYPPVTIDDVYKEVLEQAENFKKYAN